MHFLGVLIAGLLPGCGANPYKDQEEAMRLASKVEDAYGDILFKKNDRDEDRYFDGQEDPLYARIYAGSTYSHRTFEFPTVSMGGSSQMIMNRARNNLVLNAKLNDEQLNFVSDYSRAYAQAVEDGYMSRNERSGLNQEFNLANGKGNEGYFRGEELYISRDGKYSHYRMSYWADLVLDDTDENLTEDTIRGIYADVLSNPVLGFQNYIDILYRNLDFVYANTPSDTFTGRDLDEHKRYVKYCRIVTTLFNTY